MPTPARPRLRQWVYRALDSQDGGRGWERFIDGTLMTLVLLNALCVVLASVPALRLRYGALFDFVESTSVHLFTLEYVLRVWSAVEDRRYRQPWRGRLRFVLRPMSLVDLLSVLPHYLAWGGLDLRVLRMVRLFRLLKIARYVSALKVIQDVLRRKRSQLLVSLSMIGLMLVGWWCRA